MRRILIVLLALGAVSLTAVLAHAQRVSTSSLSGTWIQHFDRSLDARVGDADSSTYKIVIRPEGSSSFVASYADGSHGTFQGTVHTARSTSVVTVVYRDTDYYAVWGGQVPVQSRNCWHLVTTLPDSLVTSSSSKRSRCTSITPLSLTPNSRPKAILGSHSGMGEPPRLQAKPSGGFR